MHYYINVRVRELCHNANQFIDPFPPQYTAVINHRVHEREYRERKKKLRFRSHSHPPVV